VYSPVSHTDLELIQLLSSLGNRTVLFALMATLWVDQSCLSYGPNWCG